MKPGKVAARLAIALVMSLGVIGCMSLAGLPMNPLESTPTSPVRPRPVQASNLPDLRIPDTRVAAAPPEIPIVPLPVLPGAGPAPARLEPPVQVQTDTPPPVRTEAPPSVPTSGSGSPPARVAERALPADGLLAIRQLHTAAAQRYAGIDSYIVRLTRREQVRGKDTPEDIILFKFRKEPCSIYMKWIGPSCNGREVIYCKGRYDDKIHTLLAAGDNPLAPAGTRMSFAVDNPLVRSSSRHSITEAGIGASIERLGGVLDAVSHGDLTRGTLNYLGLVNRPEFSQPVPVVEHVIPAGVETALPRGGRRIYVFEPQSQLPLLVSARDENGHEVEYYLHDRLQCPIGLDNDDFDPDKVWKKKN